MSLLELFKKNDHSYTNSKTSLEDHYKSKPRLLNSLANFSSKGTSFALTDQIGLETTANTD